MVHTSTVFCFVLGLRWALLGGVILILRLLHVLSVVKWLNRSVLRNKGPYRDLDGSEDYLTRISKVVVKAISSSLMRS